MADCSQRYLVGIDVGGTFTDILCLDIENQTLLSAKTPSLPGKQWEGVLNALGAVSYTHLTLPTTPYV